MVSLDAYDSKPVSLGSTINSPYEDFYFVIDRENKNGLLSSNRPEGKGYGESQLVNRCKDNVNCTETEHLQYRRTEFVIIKK